MDYFKIFKDLADLKYKPVDDLHWFVIKKDRLDEKMKVYDRGSWYYGVIDFPKEDVVGFLSGEVNTMVKFDKLEKDLKKVLGPLCYPIIFASSYEYDNPVIVIYRCGNGACFVGF